MKRILVALVVIALFVPVAAGQATATDWQQYVIPREERTFDFLTVARGAMPTHQFVIRNPLQENLRIGSISRGCECVTLDYDEEKKVLETYEEMVISVRLRGDAFIGQRNSTITVNIVEPVRAEIQLNVLGDIRSDINVAPEFVNFGNVPTGIEHSRTITVTYTGHNTQWRLTDARSENEFVHAEITSDPTQTQVGRRVFRVRVLIDPSAPNGIINTHLVLVSNEAGNRREIPISIRAAVGTVLRVSPPALSLGVLQSGEPSSTRNVILSGTRPFGIVEIESDNPAIDVTIAPPPGNDTDPDAPRRVFPLMISYRNPIDGEGAPDDDGIMRASIRVTTDVPGLYKKFFVTATVRD